MSLFRLVALDSVSQAPLGANNWASSVAKALVDVGYPFLLYPGIMEVVDCTLVRHLLAQQLTAFFVPTPDNIHSRSCPSAGVIACTNARWFQQPISARNKAPLFSLSASAGYSSSFLPISSGVQWSPHRYWPPSASFPYPSGSAFLCLPVGL
jgi:hypothetical protein